MTETIPAGIPTPFMGAGIKRDLRTLLEKFQSVKSSQIRDFAFVFRELQFETVLHYKVTPSEYTEFAEYLFQNAALYFGKTNEVKALRTYIERIFGIYVCYAIYNLQPIDHVCQIPVTQMLFEELLEFQKILLAAKELEPLAALKQLLLKRAFRITVFQSTYDPATHKRYLAEEDLPNFGYETIEPFSRVKEIQNHQTTGELTYIHNAYLAAKNKLGFGDIQMVDKVNPQEALQQHLEKHTKELAKIRQRMQNGAEDDGEIDIRTQTAGNSRSELRSRAYAASMKHTRNRRYLDPNMEENFKNIGSGFATLGELAKNISNEPGPSGRKRRRRRATAQHPDVEQIDDDAVAEQVLRNEYAARTKIEIPDAGEMTMFGEKKQGTSGIAKIRAPARKKAKAEVGGVEQDTQPSTSEPGPSTPPKRISLPKKAPPRLSDDWANRLHNFNGAVAAADKQMKKLQNQIKLEPVDPDS